MTLSMAGAVSDDADCSSKGAPPVVEPHAPSLSCPRDDPHPMYLNAASRVAQARHASPSIDPEPLKDLSFDVIAP